MVSAFITGSLKLYTCSLIKRGTRSIAFQILYEHCLRDFAGTFMLFSLLFANEIALASGTLASGWILMLLFLSARFTNVGG